MMLQEPQDALKPIEDLSELQRLMRQCHDALRVEKPHFLDAFDELSKLLLAKLMDEIEVVESARGSYLFKMRPIADDLASKIDQLFSRAHVRYSGIFPDKTSIQLKPPTVAKIVQILQNSSLLDTSVDVKAGAYEAFLKSALPVGKVIGQFFTPTPIVDFAVRIISPSPGDRIIDPAVGTGGFLVSTLKRVLGYARAGGAPVRSVTKLVGLDIDPRMTRLARLNLLIYDSRIQHKDLVNISVYHHNGLIDSSTLPETLRGSFQIALTNPPFGSRETDPEILDRFELGRDTKGCSSPILFVERCLQLLEPRGRMAIVLPDSVFANPSARVVRELIARMSVILAVVKLPAETFLPYGSTAESSLLFLRRKMNPMESQGPIFMAVADTVGYDRLGKETDESDLPDIIDRYEEFLSSGQRQVLYGSSPVAFSINPPQRGERLDVKFHFHPGLDEINRLLAELSCPIKELGQVVDFRRETICPSRDSPGGEFRYIGLGNVQPETGKLIYKNAINSRDRMRANRELTPGRDIRGSVPRVRQGDVLFARLRPYLRKVFVGPGGSDFVCSTEFLVMHPTSEIHPQYLAHLLASDLALKQLQHQYTGIGRPRVTKRMVSKIRIPVPSETLQVKAVQLMDKYAAGASVLSEEIHKLTREIGTLRNNLKNDVIELLKETSNPIYK